MNAFARDLTPRLDAAIRELRAAAMEADPRIKGLWIAYDFEPGGDQVLSGVSFDRSGKALAKARELRAKSEASHG